MLRYSVNVGRPKLHDSQTAAELLDAAEELVADGGVGALSVRAVADRAGTTTRAIYTLFGGRDGLLAALGVRCMDLLHDGTTTFSTSDDPARDLVDLGVQVFRGSLVRDHPVLFALGIQGTPGDPTTRGGVLAAADRAWGVLVARIARLDVRDVRDAALAYHALCEGLGALELRGQLEGPDREGRWRSALDGLVRGWTAAGAD